MPGLDFKEFCNFLRAPEPRESVSAAPFLEGGGGRSGEDYSPRGNKVPPPQHRSQSSLGAFNKILKGEKPFLLLETWDLRCERPVSSGGLSGHLFRENESLKRPEDFVSVISLALVCGRHFENKGPPGLLKHE